MASIVRARVTSLTCVNGVLHQPGEIAEVDLDALDVDELGEQTPGLVDAGDDGPFVAATGGSDEG